MPISPSSPSWETILYGKALVRSSSSATGATSPSAKSRTVRRISSWSAERSKSMRALQRALLPRPPDRERQAGAGLDVHEQHLAVGRERRAGELLALAPSDRVEREVEDLAVGRDAAQQVLRRPVLTQQRRALRAD